jgi:hypothetical protein
VHIPTVCLAASGGIIMVKQTPTTGETIRVITSRGGYRSF